MPVSSPSTVMTIGKMKGVMVSKMAMIIAPLIMLPKRRTASARVRETSSGYMNVVLHDEGNWFDHVSGSHTYNIFDVDRSGDVSAAESSLLDPEQRHGHEYTQCQCGRGRE